MKFLACFLIKNAPFPFDRIIVKIKKAIKPIRLIIAPTIIFISFAVILFYQLLIVTLIFMKKSRTPVTSVMGGSLGVNNNTCCSIELKNPILSIFSISCNNYCLKIYLD